MHAQDILSEMQLMFCHNHTFKVKEHTFLGFLLGALMLFTALGIIIVKHMML